MAVSYLYDYTSAAESQLQEIFLRSQSAFVIGRVYASVILHMKDGFAESLSYSIRSARLAPRGLFIHAFLLSDTLGSLHTCVLHLTFPRISNKVDDVTLTEVSLHLPLLRS